MSSDVDLNKPSTRVEDVTGIRANDQWTMLRAIKLLSMVVFFTILLLLESRTISGMKVALLWRSLLLGCCVIVALPFSHARYPKFVLFGVIFAISNLTVLGERYDFLTQSSLTLKWLFFPVFFVALQRLRISKTGLEDMLVTISVAILLSCLPYYFGLLESDAQVLDLGMFGGDARFFVGPFQNSHSAAVSLALASVVFMYFGRMARSMLVTSILVCLAGFSASLLLITYIRTGYLVFVFGAALIWMGHFKENVRRKHLGLIVTSVFVIAAAIVIGIDFVVSDQVLLARLMDNSVFRGETSWSTIGSGRLLFASTALSAWWDADLAQKILGIGWVDAVAYMDNNIGQSIFSHNLFIDSLVQTGLVGLLFFLLLLRGLYEEVNKSVVFGRKHELATIFLTGYVLYSTVQGSQLFTLDIFLALSIAISRARERETCSSAYPSAVR